jgi:hypothetical protein
MKNLAGGFFPDHLLERAIVGEQLPNAVREVFADANPGNGLDRI